MRNSQRSMPENTETENTAKGSTLVIALWQAPGSLVTDDATVFSLGEGTRALIMSLFFVDGFLLL